LKRIYTLFIALTAAALWLSAQSYKTIENICYTSNTDAYAQERCKLDIYYPDSLRDCAVVVWFHGGGLTGGEKSIPEELKNFGAVVIAANYRLIPRVEISGCIDDAAQAVAWAFKHASEYGGSDKRIYVSGHSAGGYLTAMIGLDKKWLAKYGVDSDSIAALVPFSGQMISHFAYRDMHGIGNLTPTIDEYAPLFHVRAGAPKLVLITGDRDIELFGRYEENAYMWRMMQLVGHKSTKLYELGGHNHGEMAKPAFTILKNFIRDDIKNL
jgi:acetyl esterase/lipase